MEINLKNLMNHLRTNPDLTATAVYFKTKPEYIEKFVQEQTGLSFEFLKSHIIEQIRAQLVAKALKLATEGNIAMIQFCIKQITPSQQQIEAEDELNDQKNGKMIYTMLYSDQELGRPQYRNEKVIKLSYSSEMFKSKIPTDVA